MKAATSVALLLIGAMALSGCIHVPLDPPPLTFSAALQYAQAQAANLASQPLMYVSGFQSGVSGGTTAWALGFANLSSLTVTTVVVQSPGWAGAATTSFSFSTPLTPALMSAFSPMPASLTGAGQAIATAQSLVPGGVQPGLNTNYFAAAPGGVPTWTIQTYNSTWSSTVHVGPNGPTVSPWPAQSFLTAINTLKSGLQALGITSPIELIGVSGPERENGVTEHDGTSFGYQHDASVMIPPDEDFADGLSPVWVFIVYLPDLAQHMHVAVYAGLPLVVSGPEPIGADAVRVDDYVVPPYIIDPTQFQADYRAKHGAISMELLPGDDDYPWAWSWTYAPPPFPSNGKIGGMQYSAYFDAETGERIY